MGYNTLALRLRHPLGACAAGKSLLMKIFDSLGNGHAVTKMGRRKLANLLFN
jgi:thioredoxin-like negative regulator of GroEL